MSSAWPLAMHGRSQLFSAVINLDADEVAKELDNGGDPNAMEPMFTKAFMLGTPLMQAAALGDLKSVKALASKTTPNAKTRLGKTALMHAAASSHAPIVEVLAKIENPREKDENGRSALFMIGGNFNPRGQSLSEESQIECAKWLLAFGGAGLGLMVDNGGETALMAAAAGRNEELAIFLMDHCDVRAVDGNGRTALMRAAAAGCERLVAALAPLSDIMAADNNGVDAAGHAEAVAGMGIEARAKICGIILAAHEKKTLERAAGAAAPRRGDARRQLL